MGIEMKNDPLSQRVLEELKRKLPPLTSEQERELELVMDSTGTPGAKRVADRHKFLRDFVEVMRWQGSKVEAVDGERRP